MNFFNELYYRYQLGQYNFNYSEGTIANFTADLLLTKTWKDLSYSNFWITIITDDDYKITFWDENKYYAYFVEDHYLIIINRFNGNMNVLMLNQCS